VTGSVSTSGAIWRVDIKRAAPFEAAPTRHESYSLAVAIALILPIALMLTALLLAALTRVLALLIGIVSTALLLTALLAALMLLSALVWIIHHCVDSFRKLPGGKITVEQMTSSPLTC
jgi:hypothetical protein